jgi:predicted transcriptional regulator
VKTIKQLADEIGVSKTAIRKKMTEEVKTKFAETVSGTIYILPEGQELIRQAFSQGSAQTRFSGVSANQLPSISDEVSSLISMLQVQLEVKDKQIEARDIQIGELTAALENTTASLHAAQALHAGTMHKQLKSGAEDRPIGLWDRIFRRKTETP